MSCVVYLSWLICVVIVVRNVDARIFRSDYVPGYANFTYIKDDAVLQGTVIATFDNQTVKECEGKCYDEYWCKSINIEKSGLKTCELNMESEADKTFLLTLTKKSGWQFRSTDFTDPLIGEVCKRLKPCPPGYLCMDSSRCPRYKCYECRTINLGIHCSKPMHSKALGIADNTRIKDYQMSSSSDNGEHEIAYNGRINSDIYTRWCPKKKAQMQNEYLRVDFVNRKIITGIAIGAVCFFHENGKCAGWVESYKILYTSDSYQWMAYKESGTEKIFDGYTSPLPTTINDLAKQNFSVYFRAFAVKINPITFVRYMCLRMELYGIGCANPVKPLGMGSSTILDAQITASSTHSLKLSPWKARLNHYSAWGYLPPDTSPYLQVDLLTLKVVTDIATQGRHNIKQFVRTYYIGYSEVVNTFTPINNRDGTKKGTVITTFENQTVKECEGKCYDEYWCKSINIEKSGLKTCELNMESEADKTFLLTLTKKSGWQFRSTDFTDPLIGEVCKRLKPCPPGYLCMDSSRCPRYKCYECRTINLGIHCSKPMHATPLGIGEYAKIRNYQMSSSSDNNVHEKAYNGRINSNEYMRWCAKKSTQMQNEYLRVDFITRKIITGIAIGAVCYFQAYGKCGGWVESYKILYTTDSYQWMTKKENGTEKIFDGYTSPQPTTINDLAKQNFSVYFRAFAVKINPITFVNYMCLRMELYGIEDPIQPPKPQGCASPVRPLGMGSSAILQAQITASSSYKAGLSPWLARLNHYSAWGNLDADTSPYLQVDLLTLKVVTDIATQGRYEYKQFVTTYNIGYSEVVSSGFTPINDNNAMKKLFNGNVDNRGIVKNKLEPPIRARVIRVYPISHVDHICMRIELYGCEPV
eukprot:gene104-714_t